MKLGSIAVILFAALAIGALLVGVSVHTDSKEPPAEQVKAVEIFKEHADTDNVQSMLYESYAQQALDENRLDQHALFCALSYSRRVAYGRNVVILERLGSDYTLPQHIIIMPSTTDRNIDASTESQRNRLLTAYDAQDAFMTFAGYKFATRVLIQDASIIKQHLGLLNSCRQPHSSARQAYFVCPVCGSTYSCNSCDACCPLCYTDCNKFLFFY